MVTDNEVPGGTLLRFLARAWLRLRYQILDRRYRHLVLEAIDGVPLLVLPDVFNPVLLRTGEFMVRALADMPLSAGERVLDLGCGTGVGAIFAARRGAQVVGADLNPEAVRCGQINALLNHLEHQIEFQAGDLFQPVAGEVFDLVLFNPPFFRGEPKDELDRAWRSKDVLERFASGLAGHLTADGRALLVLSSDGPWQDALTALSDNEFAARLLLRMNLINEVLSAYTVQRVRVE